MQICGCPLQWPLPSGRGRRSLRASGEGPQRRCASSDIYLVALFRPGQRRNGRGASILGAASFTDTLASLGKRGRSNRLERSEHSGEKKMRRRKVPHPGPLPASQGEGEEEPSSFGVEVTQSSLAQGEKIEVFHRDAHFVFSPEPVGACRPTERSEHGGEKSSEASVPVKATFHAGCFCHRRNVSSLKGFSPGSSWRTWLAAEV